MSTKLAQAQALLNRAQTLLALASSYAVASIQRNRLEELGAPSYEHGELDKGIRAYERAVALWMDNVDEASDSPKRNAAIVHASWFGRTGPILDLVPHAERSAWYPRANPARHKPDRRKPARLNAGRRSGQRSGQRPGRRSR
jgi:hypothetical protein